MAWCRSAIIWTNDDYLTDAYMNHLASMFYGQLFRVHINAKSVFFTPIFLTGPHFSKVLGSQDTNFKFRTWSTLFQDPNFPDMTRFSKAVGSQDPIPQEFPAQTAPTVWDNKMKASTLCCTHRVLISLILFSFSISITFKSRISLFWNQAEKPCQWKNFPQIRYVLIRSTGLNSLTPERCVIILKVLSLNMCYRFSSLKLITICETALTF